MRTPAALGESLHAWLAEAGDALVSVFFPADCRICGALLVRSSRVPVCEACLSSLEAHWGKKCEICGQPQPAFAIQEGESVFCRSCQQGTYAFHRARSFGLYEGTLARLIVMLKWERIDPLAAWFATRLADVTRREGELLACDIVVPVPLHSRREKERGYNQASLISRSLAKKLRLPHKEMLLMRTRPRPDKQTLSLEERWLSVRGAFATRPGSQVDNQRVLLVDDVMTTGATLDACARALLGGGAKAVVAVTVARAANHPLPFPEAGRQKHDGRQPAKVG